METNYIARHIRRNLLEGSKSAEGRFARICYGGQEILFYRPEDLAESFCIRKGGMEFTICMKKYPEFGAVDWQMTATNHSDEPSRFLTELDIAYLGIPLPPQEPLIHKGILGDSCTGESFLPFTNNVEIGDSISIRPKNGKSSQGAFPFFDICGSHDGLICGIGWSGTWLSNPEAVDWITELVAGFIEESRIDIYRQDFNLYPDTYWAKKDSADRKGITEIKYMEGLYRFWDTLLERFPHLLIDNCASGGNRIDLESCARSVFCWRSDTGCYPVSESMKTALWNQNQNLALSSYIVYHAIASWDPSAYDMRSAMSNGLAGSFDVRSPACDFERIHVALAECERLRKYWEEDFYPLSEADLREDHWSMCQFGSQDSGVLLAFRREKDREERHTIALQGLDMDSDYLVRISDEEHHMVERIVSAGSLAAGYAFELKRPGSSLAMEYIRQ